MSKKPKNKEKPPYRQPQNRCDPASFDKEHLRVEHNLLDLDHDHWGWNNLTPEQSSAFFSFIKSMEKLTWAQIKQTPGGRSVGSTGTNHHPLELDALSERAQERLRALNLTTLVGDDIFSLRVKGIVRIYGARDGYIFRPIWHDPFHDDPEKAVYILKKK